MAAHRCRGEQGGESLRKISWMSGEDCSTMLRDTSVITPQCVNETFSNCGSR
jgi:hypothetical protein